MFVEQLSREDLIDYITKHELVKYDEYTRSQYNFNAITDYNVCEGNITFRINNKKFMFTDFDYLENSRKSTHNKRWLYFMFKKFGNPYKLAFLAFREQEKKRKLKAIEKGFDDETLKYVDGFYVNYDQVDDVLTTFRKDLEAMLYEEREEFLKECGFNFGTPDDEKSL